MEEEYLYDIADEGDITEVVDNDIIYDQITKSNDNLEDILSFMKNYEDNIINYKTPNILSKYERTRVLTERAQQIEDGSEPYISNVERFTTSYAIAVEELNSKKIPFIIRRSIPHSNLFEYWKLKDMII